MSSPTVFNSYINGKQYIIASMIGFDERNDNLIIDHIRSIETEETVAEEICSEWLRTADVKLTEFYFLQNETINGATIAFSPSDENAKVYEYTSSYPGIPNFKDEYQSLNIKLKETNLWVKQEGGFLKFSDSESSFTIQSLKSQQFKLDNVKALYEVTVGGKVYIIPLYCNFRMLVPFQYDKDGNIHKYSTLVDNNLYVDLLASLLSKSQENKV